MKLRCLDSNASRIMFIAFLNYFPFFGAHTLSLCTHVLLFYAPSHTPNTVYPIMPPAMLLLLLAPITRFLSFWF